MMNGHEKSDSATVAAKPTNEVGRPGEEPVEPRAGTEGNAEQDGAPRTPSRAGASHGLDRVRQTARERKKEKFTALLHHIDVGALARGVLRLEEDGRAGRRRIDVEDLRVGPRAQARGTALAGPSGSVSGDAQPAGLYPQAGWTAAPAGGRRAGGQDCPTGDDDGAERDSTRKISSASAMGSDRGAARMTRWTRWWWESQPER